MCGFLVTCDNNLSDIVFKKSLLNFQSRGPDKSKVIDEQNITFGFHRLSIIDEQIVCNHMFIEQYFAL